MRHYLELGLIIFNMMGGISNSKLFGFQQLKEYCPGPVSSLTGIQFGDNGGQNYVTDENGVAMVTTQVYFSIIV